MDDIAERDADLANYMLHADFAKLSNAPYKRDVEIGAGTQTVIVAKNRMQLFQAVQQFLDERLAPGLWRQIQPSPPTSAPRPTSHIGLSFVFSIPTIVMPTSTMAPTAWVSSLT